MFYAEHSLHLFPHHGHGNADEEALTLVLRPVVYWLVLTSIVVHGLSIPLLNYLYELHGVDPMLVDPQLHPRHSLNAPIPSNASIHNRHSIVVYNKFTRPRTAASIEHRPGWMDALAETFHGGQRHAHELGVQRRMPGEGFAAADKLESQVNQEGETGEEYQRRHDMEIMFDLSTERGRDEFLVDQNGRSIGRQ